MIKTNNHADVLSNFVDLFTTNRGAEVNMTTQRSFERDEVTDSSSDSDNGYTPEGFGRAMKSELTELFEHVLSRSSIRLNEEQKACIQVMIDSVYESRGLFGGSYEEVAAEYAPIFGKLKVAELNRARVFLMHQDPLGLACRSSQEFKWVVSRHFAAGNFGRDYKLQNRQLVICFKHLVKGGNELVNMFVELCRAIYKEAKASRRLSPTKVQRLLKCNETEAAILCEVYESLPDYPLG